MYLHWLQALYQLYFCLYFLHKPYSWRSSLTQHHRILLLLDLSCWHVLETFIRILDPSSEFLSNSTSYCFKFVYSSLQILSFVEQEHWFEIFFINVSIDEGSEFRIYIHRFCSCLFTFLAWTTCFNEEVLLKINKNKLDTLISGFLNISDNYLNIFIHLIIGLFVQKISLRMDLFFFHLIVP